MNPHSHLPLGGGAEFDAIRALISVWGKGASGLGDDAALVDIPPGEQLVVSTDACIEGTHFRRGWLSPREIGGRAAAAALSDLAAMGAHPRGLLLSLAFPPTWRDSLEELARGVGDVAARASCPIVGGNMSVATELSITTTVLGSTTRPLRRSGAMPGDRLYITGHLGGPGAALVAFLGGRTPGGVHRARFASPVPRIAEAAWLAERGASAAIDISDGLLADAGHLASASDVGIHLITEMVPCVDGVAPGDAILSGEEYELLIAVPPGTQVDAAEFMSTFGVPLTPIGVVVPRGIGGAVVEQLL